MRPALPMFLLSMLFLAVVAALIVLGVDVPRLDPHAETAEKMLPSGAGGVSASVGVPPDVLGFKHVAQGLCHDLLKILAFLWVFFQDRNFLCSHGTESTMTEW